VRLPLRDVQHVLNQLSYTLRVDGVMGPKTSRALALFRSDHFLGPGESVDELLAAYIEIRLMSPPPPPEPPTREELVRGRERLLALAQQLLADA
jgi:peptidoglycan hydrolase-like protein with peptidoglycan-binding domain